jgi:endonuclease YncB( thermonuclease family)
MKKLLLLTAILSSALYADEYVAQDEVYRDLRGVEYIRAVDGDTVEVNIRGMHPVFGKNLKIRVADIDAAEMRTSDPCEKRMAILAKEFVHADSVDHRSLW